LAALYSCPSVWTLDFLIYYFPTTKSDTKGYEVAAIVAGETIGLATGRDRRKESEVSGVVAGTQRKGATKIVRMDGSEDTTANTQGAAHTGHTGHEVDRETHYFCD